MADKRQVKRSIKQLQHVKTWQLLILLILCVFIAATFLRLNNIGMAQRRTAVLQADESGATAQVLRARLYDLQRYVTSHMNADMGTISLKNQYARDYQAALDAASGANDPSSTIFRDAQKVCAPKYASLGHYSLAYQQCVIDQLNSHPVATAKDTAPILPKADSYRHSFASPLWSPDFAGFSVLACVLLCFTIVARLIGIFMLRMILKSRNRGV